MAHGLVFNIMTQVASIGIFTVMFFYTVSVQDLPSLIGEQSYPPKKKDFVQPYP
jgi:hypothetical protein